ncbi:MAG: hypothetical protein ACYC2X_09420 [Coriobacteriia bacterium]|jgi:hypothetical protein
MSMLKAPTPELSERIMRPVNVNDYVLAFRLNGRSRVGGRLFTVPQVHAFLSADDACLDADELVQWVAGPVGDGELAEAIATAYESCSTGYERMQAARALIGERLVQVRG